MWRFGHLLSPIFIVDVIYLYKADAAHCSLCLSFPSTSIDQAKFRGITSLIAIVYIEILFLVQKFFVLLIVVDVILTV
jgi:hypothetical protein